MTPKQNRARIKLLEKRAKDPEYLKRDTSSDYYRNLHKKKDIDPYEDVRY